MAQRRKETSGGRTPGNVVAAALRRMRRREGGESEEEGGCTTGEGDVGRAGDAEAGSRGLDWAGGGVFADAALGDEEADATEDGLAEEAEAVVGLWQGDGVLRGVVVLRLQ